MHMKEYLNETAERITARPLLRFDSRESFERWRKERQALFHRMTGLDVYLRRERTPLSVRWTGTIDCETHVLRKLYFESLPGLYVAAHLYVPKHLRSPAPGMLYLCGHHKLQKIHFQDHARRFAQLGFVTLVLDTIQLGETFGEHHGTYRKEWFHWISRGYTPAAAEVWNAIRGIDLLCGLGEVDPLRLGVTGISGGGSISWWVACADDRIRAVATASGTGNLASHIRDRSLDNHCDCNFPNNPYGWSLAESYALAAPRPVLILAPDRDYWFNVESVRQVHGQLRQLYDQLNAGEQLELFVYGGPHTYSPEARKRIFSWFMRHLQGLDISPDEVGDIDGVRLPAEQLLVFHGNPPADDRSLTVQDWFVPLPAPMPPETPEQLQSFRDEIVARMKEECFAAFPRTARPAAAVIRQQSWETRENCWIHQFCFESEENWTLWGEIRGAFPDPFYKPEADLYSIGGLRTEAAQRPEAGQHPEAGLRPAVVRLRRPGDAKGQASLELLRAFPEQWLKVRIDPRGTGDTAWGAELDRHIRRAAALTGRTVASMRVWDTLRGLEAVRGLPGVDPDKIVLAASEDMAVVALYAALLDGGLAGVVLERPPATLDAPDDPEAGASFREIINALRHADLPQAAACLWPARIVFVGEMPESYRWAERVYERLGNGGRFVAVAKPAELASFLKKTGF